MDEEENEVFMTPEEKEVYALRMKEEEEGNLRRVANKLITSDDAAVFFIESCQAVFGLIDNLMVFDPLKMAYQTGLIQRDFKNFSMMKDMIALAKRDKNDVQVEKLEGILVRVFRENNGE